MGNGVVRSSPHSTFPAPHYRITGSDGFQQAPIGVAINFAELVVRRSFAEITDPITEQIFVAVVRLLGQREDFLKKRGLNARVERLLGARGSGQGASVQLVGDGD